MNTTTVRMRAWWRRASRAASTAANASPPWSTYDLEAFRKHYYLRPHRLARRAWQILSRVGYLRLVNGILKRGSMEERAVRLRIGLTTLGPSFVKLGQALATRPDLLPPEYCLELTKLQDRLPPFPEEEARQILKEELQQDPKEVFESFSHYPVGAASLGQVYKARLRGDATAVAVKVQRPRLQEQVALDAVVLSMLAKRYAGKYGIQSDAALLVDELVGRIFLELDYKREANNLDRFRKLYDTRDTHGTNTPPGGTVHVPKVFYQHSTSKVITMEWMDGIKLTDQEGVRRLGLDTQKLVETGVFCGIKQLLEDGFFHADAHPGNLMASPGGALIYLDFGNVAEVHKSDRDGLVKAFVAYVNNDPAALVLALQSLDFLSPSTTTGDWIAALSPVFEEKSGPKKMDFAGAVQHIANVAKLADIPFRVPPRLAPVIRSLAALEGTASAVQSGFQVVSRSYPYVLRVLLKDRSPAMRRMLQSIVLNTDGTVRWNRVKRLTEAVKNSNNETGGRGFSEYQETYMQALEDGILFLLSEHGKQTRRALELDLLDAYRSTLGEFADGNLSTRGKMIFSRLYRTSEQSSFALHLLLSDPNFFIQLVSTTTVQSDGLRALFGLFLGLCRETGTKAMEGTLLTISRQMHRWTAA